MRPPLEVRAAQVARPDIIPLLIIRLQHVLQPAQQDIIQLQERRPAQAALLDIIPQPLWRLPVPHVYQVATRQRLRPRVHLVSQDTAALDPPH